MGSDSELMPVFSDIRYKQGRFMKHHSLLHSKLTSQFH
jgi:hypothetical protein